MIAIAVVVALLVVGALYYWLVVVTEGVFLGQRVVVWLYDITAHRYDSIKQFNDEAEAYFVIRPLLNRLAHLPAPIIVDVATGTGRVPHYLLAEPVFNGRILGVDASAKMLSHAHPKLAPYRGRVQLVQQRADTLPIATNACDAVTCLESLEFFPSAPDALAEMSRILRSGGTLMITWRKGWEAKTFLNRYRGKGEFAELLHELGFVDVEIRPWQVDYDLVLCYKA